MSCCRRSPRFSQTSRAVAVSVCGNCRSSLREELRLAVDALQKSRPTRGTHRADAELRCRCGWVTKMPVVWVKR